MKTLPSWVECKHCGYAIDIGDLALKPTKIKSGWNVWYKCRECNRACDTERLRKYRQTEKGRAVTRMAVKKSTNAHPIETKARYLLNMAVKKHEILKPSKCSLCDKEGRIEAHHADYSKPLCVQWVCRVCHNNVHKSLS